MMVLEHTVVKVKGPVKPVNHGNERLLVGVRSPRCGHVGKVDEVVFYPRLFIKTVRPVSESESQVSLGRSSHVLIYECTDLLM